MSNKIFKTLLILIVPNLLLAERFIKKGEIVYDNETKLYWQSRPTTKKFSWRNAIKYCRNLNYGGYSDWRLPNIDELKSLVDYNRCNPAIATTLIDIKTDDCYWSSSKYISDSSRSWFINFNYGDVSWSNKSDKNYALCVR